MAERGEDAVFMSPTRRPQQGTVKLGGDFRLLFISDYWSLAGSIREGGFRALRVLESGGLGFQAFLQR